MRKRRPKQEHRTDGTRVAERPAETIPTPLIPGSDSKSVTDAVLAKAPETTVKATLPEFIKRSSVTDWCIALFTLILTITGLYQWRVTDGQLGVMRSDERAWLKFELPDTDSGHPNGPFSLSVSQPVIARYQVANLGKTPATNIVVHGFLEILDAGQGPDLARVKTYEDGSLPRSVSGILFPNDASLTNRPLRRTNDEPLSQSDWDALVIAKKYIAVYGIVWYDDVFKVRHWSKFCRFGHPAQVPPNTSFNAKDCAEFSGVGEE